MDPSTLMMAADGAKKLATTPIGVLQSFFGAKRARKNERLLEGMVNSYKPNESIMDYYNKALSRYNSNPYQSTTYQTQMQNAGRTTATGLGGLQDRRSAVGGVSRLAGIQNDAMLKAGMGAEAEQGQRLNQLAGATDMKQREDKYKFENKYNLLAMKAGSGNAMLNTGLKNIFG